MNFTIVQILSTIVTTVIGFVIGYKQAKKKASSASIKNESEENIQNKEE